MKMKRPRVLLADDHAIVAAGIASLLEADFELVGIVENGRALVPAVQKLDPDVVLVDISMPLLNGIEAVRRLKKAGSQVAFIFLTMHPEVTYARRCLEVGASGYLLKHAAASELTIAIGEVLKGRLYVTPMIAKEVFQSLMADREPEKPVAEATPRQREVLQLLAEGHCVKGIASILEISPRTVEFHKLELMKRLNFHSTSDLVRYAIKKGIIGLS